MGLAHSTRACLSCEPSATYYSIIILHHDDRLEHGGKLFETKNRTAMTPPTKLQIRPAGLKGRGVFALSPINAGSAIVALGGHLRPSAALNDDLLALQVGPDLWLCSDGSLLDDCINHSCDPNAGFVTGEPVLFALRDISEAGWSLACQCGAAGCRGIIRPWGELAAADRLRLRRQTLQYMRDR
jgi:hypothetical protein